MRHSNYKVLYAARRCDVYYLLHCRYQDLRKFTLTYLHFPYLACTYMISCSLKVSLLLYFIAWMNLPRSPLDRISSRWATSLPGIPRTWSIWPVSRGGSSSPPTSSSWFQASLSTSWCTLLENSEYWVICTMYSILVVTCTRKIVQKQVLPKIPFNASAGLNQKNARQMRVFWLAIVRKLSLAPSKK